MNDDYCTSEPAARVYNLSNGTMWKRPFNVREWDDPEAACRAAARAWDLDDGKYTFAVVFTDDQEMRVLETTVSKQPVVSTRDRLVVM